MKIKLKEPFQTGLLAAACGLLLLGSAAQSQAQTFITESYTNTFDVGANAEPFAGSGSVASWIYWFNTPGGNTPMTNDVTMDAGNDPSSGSLLVVSPFTNSTQNVFFGTFGNQWGYDFGTRADLTKYTNVTFDIRVDTNMVPNGSGNFGNIGVGMINASYGYQQFGSVTIPASATNGWVHFEVQINQTLANLQNAPGIALAYNSYSGYPFTTMVFWIDNVAVHLTPGPPPPPPVVSLSKANPGLNLINTPTAGANGRQNIHPINPAYSWVGAPNPVSFEITIKDYPVAPTGYQTHLFLAPESSLQYGAGDTSVDWNCTNLVFVQIQNTPEGAGQMTFMYKTNFGGGWGGQIFGSNNLGAVNSAVMNGTWKIGFANDTNITLTAPDNTITNLTMPPDSAAMFAGSVFAWIGSQANGTDKVGLSSIIERIKVTGFPSDNIDDTFPGPGLDTNVWANSASDPSGVQVVAAGTAYWLDWTVPDIGFSPQSSPTVGAAAVWTDVTSPRVLFNGKRHAQVAAPSSTSGYYRLVKRTASKLQVLLASETNAPGAVGGKVGTIDPVVANTPISVTIHSTDPDWNITGSVPSHTVHLAISPEDPLAFIDPDAPLVDGTATILVQFGTPGSYTITATDVTDGTLTTGTSSTITVVNP
jgi:hypothetical protein